MNADSQPGEPFWTGIIPVRLRILFERAAEWVRTGPYRLGFIRSHARWRLLEGVFRTKTLLFVCKGNICRSPFAEYYARRVLSPEVRVFSRGYFGGGGTPSPPEAVDAAAERGVDLGEHLSRPLREEEVREAGSVVVFDDKTFRAVLRRYPFARGKAFYFGLLSADGPLCIRDPFGGPHEAFRATYASIVEALDLFAGEVCKGVGTVRGQVDIPGRPGERR